MRPVTSVSFISASSADSTDSGIAVETLIRGVLGHWGERHDRSLPSHRSHRTGQPSPTFASRPGVAPGGQEEKTTA